MSKARKRFVLYAILGVFLLMTVLLGIINGVNYTMAGEDADHLTQTISENQGMLRGGRHGMNPGGGPEGRPERSWLTGPDSPEMTESLRYFTYAFDQDGQAERIFFAVSAVTEEEAEEWARSLIPENRTGWTDGVYRYRVWEMDGKTWVTVIDQSRELNGFYRILNISLIGLIAGTVISALTLGYLGQRLFQPLEEADRKQKRFISNAEREFRIPLTVVSADLENWERQNGESEESLSIHRQVKRMTGLVQELGSAGLFGEQAADGREVDLAAMARAAGEQAAAGFDAQGTKLRIRAEQPVRIQGDGDALEWMMGELLENARKFTTGDVLLSVREDGGHAVIETVNDAPLKDGNREEAMDRFTRLENAEEKPGAGLGLARVRETVQAHNGRIRVIAENGKLSVRINL